MKANKCGCPFVKKKKKKKERKKEKPDVCTATDVALAGEDHFLLQGH